MPAPPPAPRPIPVAPASVLTAEAAWSDVLVRTAVCTEWEWPPEEDRYLVLEPESRFMPPVEVRRFLDIASVTVGSGVLLVGHGYIVCDVTDADRIRWARRTMDLLRLQKRDEPVTVSESLDAMENAKLCAEAFTDLFHLKHFQDPEDASEQDFAVHWAFDEPIQPYMYSVAWLVAHASVPLAPLNSWNAAQLFDELLLLGAEHDDGLPALSCTTTSGTPSSLRCTTSGSDDSDDDAPSEATILDGASAADDDVDDDDFTSTQDAAGVAGQLSQTSSHSHSSLDEGSLDAPQTVQLFVVPPPFDDDDGGDDGPSDELADADDADFRPRAALHTVNLWAPRRCFALALLVEVTQMEADLEDACLHEFGEALDAAVSTTRDDHIPELPQGLLEGFDAFCHRFRLSRHLIAHASRADLWRRYVTALDVLVAQFPTNASLCPAPRGSALTLAQRAAAILWQSRFPRWLVAAVLLQHAEALTTDDMSQLLEATVLREMPWLNDFDHQVRTDVMLIQGHCPLKALTRHLQEHHRRLRGPRVPFVKGQSLVARSPFPNPNFVPKDDFQLRIFTDTVVQMRRDAFLRVFGDLAPRGYA